MRRTALITGGSRGLGLALARHLAADGWNLVVNARDAEALERARREIDAAGPGTVIALAGDIADPVHVAALVNAAAGQGGLELLVNNAGTLGPSPLPHVAWLRTGDLERILRTNVVAPLRLMQAALPHLRAARGAIVNMTSDAAVEGYEGWGGYGASKAALEQLSRVLGGGGERRARHVGRPWGHADADAPGRVPGRGHLRSPDARKPRSPASCGSSTSGDPAAATESRTCWSRRTPGG